MLRQETAKSVIRRYIARLPIKVEQAILFGSTATGDRLSDSDIDLIVISDDFKDMPLPERFLILQKNWKEQTDLEAFGFTSQEYEQLRFKSIVVREADEKGIRLIKPPLQPGEPVGEEEYKKIIAELDERRKNWR
jgi:predicted nucleotidyltransferase